MRQRNSPEWGTNGCLCSQMGWSLSPVWPYTGKRGLANRWDGGRGGGKTSEQQQPMSTLKFKSGGWSAGPAGMSADWSRAPKPLLTTRSIDRKGLWKAVIGHHEMAYEEGRLRLGSNDDMPGIRNHHISCPFPSLQACSATSKIAQAQPGDQDSDCMSFRRSLYI